MIDREDASNCHCVKLDLTSGKRFWLGLRKSKSNGNWSWDDGSEYSYKNWDIGEPNSCCPMDPIPIHSYVGGNGLWYDTGELHYPLPDGYVCKYKHQCAEDWNIVWNRCYKYVNATVNSFTVPETYTVASTICQGYNATLTSIGSTVEELYLKTLTGGVPFWVGLQRDSDRWFWTDGTDSASLPWKSKEFSNCCENDEVTVIYNQGLQVVTVEDWQTGFVCKIDGDADYSPPAEMHIAKTILLPKKLEQQYPSATITTDSKKISDNCSFEN
ncbi:unnamed protein product [Enterobius vermicularis]|uniref:C-type lectin domain-containing protein n=1 Tax=Enterobius vermicularis TaxID=51028 RepID=A0A0N4UX72_ENTVE|nr:unnamed protein product [Enterobius vermicularis]